MRSIILVNDNRAKVIDVDTGATVDALVTIQRQRRDSTGIALKVCGAICCCSCSVPPQSRTTQHLVVL